MKRARYGLGGLLVLLIGLGGGLALGQLEGNGQPSTEPTESEEGKAIPPSINDERTFYAGEKDVTTQHVVRANRFELADQKGNIRAVLGLNPDGEPRLALADESGRILVTLSLELDYKFTKDKIPTLRFLDRAGKVRSEINLNRMGDPVIMLRNQQGGAIASLSSTEKTGTEWMLMDEKGRPRITQNINRNGANVSFFDEAGKVRAGLGLKKNGDPILVFSDEKMKNRVMLGYADSTSGNKESKDGKRVSSLALFDKDGNILWKAP